MDLSTNITYIQGIGPKRAEVLEKEIAVSTVADLLTYFPYRYIDRSRFYYIHEIDDSLPYIQLKGRIASFEKMGEGRSRRLIAHFTDGNRFIDLVWFQGIKYVENRLKINVPYIVFGKPTRYGSRYNIPHPEVDPITKVNIQKTNYLQAFYNTTEKMKNNFLNSTAIRNIIFTALKSVSNIDETLPKELVEKYHLMSRKEALFNIHLPQNNDILQKAQYRLKFEELFYTQLSIVRQTKYREKKFKGYVFGTIGKNFNSFYQNHLPFELTNAQKRVLREIRSDMKTGKQMNRLLQGDVGSGKTMVALMSSLIALDNGFQVCLMAPTEILAAQHFSTISELLKPMNIETELLTGSTKKSDRNRILNNLKNGELKILIGTHALIEDTVIFSNLGLVIIDEQHRFGVAQRAKLWSKNIQPPHVLVMTATPIPRTLAMTIYGDLDVSVIDELPPGRKPVQTLHLFDNRRDSINNFLKKQLEEGRQIYIVYPLIQESEKLDLKNLEDGYEYTKEHFPQYKVSIVHGRMKPAEKDVEMQKFSSGATQILVATTVIEVGVNVPNASVMVIESAERFGLSQLHQLRGRVGRGANQSYCILMSSYKITSDTQKRLSTMTQTTDGFEIAEADLQFRGPGDIEGTQQSGLPFDLKIANLAKDGKLLQLARDIALELIEKDPFLELQEHIVLKKNLQKLQRSNINWSMIS
ncbi:MAG: ATP-dependent DNA helicase RecG [Paludibacteraceae bacterium]|nr:ATP-dependent DNA helicase RecG [Paludibacteraceae bacterium]